MAKSVEDRVDRPERWSPWVLGATAAVVVSPLVALPCIEAMALRLPPESTGEPAVGFIQVFVYAFILVAPIVAILTVAYALAKGCVNGCALGVVVAFLLLGAFLGGDMIADHVRLRAFRSLAARSGPVVAAIKAYEQDHDRPPGSLRELVPEYLPTMPTTGLEVYPSYGYVVGDKARAEHEGNPWALVIETPQQWWSSDRFVYYPLGNYPESYHDFAVERVGDWAYLYYSD